MARRDVDAIVDSLERAAERVVKAVVLNCTAELIERTPVDTGWAQANWVPSVGQPVESIEGTPEAVSNSVQVTGQGAVAAFKLEQGACFISNNVPYIPALNDGHSEQAPAGFVEQSIEHAIQETTRDLASLEAVK